MVLKYFQDHRKCQMALVQQKGRLRLRLCSVNLNVPLRDQYCTMQYVTDKKTQLLLNNLCLYAADERLLKEKGNKIS